MLKLSFLNLQKHLQLNVRLGIVMSVFLWIYLILRAYYVPFLHDEISTFWFHINTGDFIPFTYRLDSSAANNHVLNTLISWFFYKVFGCAPFVLRLANLMFVPVYCFFTYKIATVLKNKYLALLFWMCFLFIHSIVEFMALSRGYGMGFALLSGSIWYLIRVMKSGKAIHYLLSLLFLTGSVAANLSLMATAIIIVTFLLINIVVENKPVNTIALKTGIVICAGFVPLAFLAACSFALQKAGALYYGQLNSFWGQSVNTLLNALFNGQGVFLKIATSFYFVLSLILLIYFIFKHFTFHIFRQPVLIFPSLLVGNIAAVLLLNYLFKVNFPEDRSGFYFYYFFIGSVFFLLDKFVETSSASRVAWLALPLVLIPLHFVYAGNFTHVAVYKEDRVPDRFYDEIKAKSDTMPEPATVGSYHGRVLVLAYRNYLANGNVAVSYSNNYPSLVPDFQVIDTDELPGWNLYYNAIDYDAVSGYHLLERKHKLQRHTIFEVKGISTNGYRSDEFFNLSGGDADTLAQKSLYLEYDMDIESPAEPFVAWIVVGVTDTAGNNVAYENIPLNWIKPSWNVHTKHYNNGQLLTKIPPGSKTFVTYIWNIKKVPFSISNAKITIRELEPELAGK